MPYFTKPIIREELITRIRTHLNLQRQSRKRQQAERKLNEERKIRAKFLEAVPVGVFVTDADGQPYYANQMAQQILGKGIVDTTRKQLTETYQVYLADTECIYPEDEAPLNLALKGKKTRVDNMEIYQRGRKIPLEASATPIHNEKGEISYAIAAFQDITERKKFTRQLAEAKANLELKVAERTKELSQTVAELRKVYFENRIWYQ